MVKNQLFPLSGQSRVDLSDKIKTILNRIKTDQIDRDQIYRELINRNQNLCFRSSFVAGDKEEIVAGLKAAINDSTVMPVKDQVETWQVIFSFQGLGDQYFKMAEDLYQENYFFKRLLNYCSEIISPFLKTDLIRLLYHENNEELLKTPAIAHTLLFSIGFCMAKLWIHSGITPSAVIGHSLGEYIAAAIAGVFELEDVLPLVYQRAKMVQAIPGGAMLAVMQSEQEISGYLTEKLSIAAINGPTFLTVSGPSQEIEALRNKLAQNGIAGLPLATTHAFHTRQLFDLKDEFLTLFNDVPLSRPAMPIISNLTGTWNNADTIITPLYWLDQMCHTVRFYEGIKEISQKEAVIFIETGPGETLSSFINQALLFLKGPQYQSMTLKSLQSRSKKQNDMRYFLSGLGKLWE